jgi:PAS domain S-box-containing protein
MEHVFVAMAMFDLDVRYLVTSAHWSSNYNTTPIGRSHYEVVPEISGEWKAVHQRCLAGAIEHSEGERFVRADGSVLWIKREVRPWRDCQGVIGGVVIRSEDITK